MIFLDHDPVLLSDELAASVEDLRDEQDQPERQLLETEAKAVRE